MYWITNQLALGGLTSIPVSDEATAILNLFEEQPYEIPAHVVYLHKGFPDEQPFPIETIWECVRWIDRHVADGHRVLVHCAEGNSRSVSVVIAYLIFTGCSLEAAKSLILSKKRFHTERGVETSNPLQFHDSFFTQWKEFLTRQVDVEY
jgi:protein-tyrosine phosphatase